MGLSVDSVINSDVAPGGWSVSMTKAFLSSDFLPAEMEMYLLTSVPACPETISWRSSRGL